MNIDEIKAALISSSWNSNTLELAISADFRCAYCNRYFLKDIEAWYSFELDHIVPKGEGPDTNENLVPACRLCNRFKRRYDPRQNAGPNPSRNDLISAAKDYIEQKRSAAEEKVQRERSLAEELISQLKMVEPTS